MRHRLIERGGKPISASSGVFTVDPLHGCLMRLIESVPMNQPFPLQAGDQRRIGDCGQTVLRDS